MAENSLYNQVEAAASVISHRLQVVPKVALVLGSGLGEIANRVVHERVVISYDEIPGFEMPGVAGHAGKVIAGDLAGVPVLIYQGRFHYYEGHELSTVTLPTRVAAELGVKTIILTAATGGIAEGLKPGDLCCLTDHINLLGNNPLRGPHDARLGSRFPDMSEVYSRKLRQKAQEVAQCLGITLHPAVYAAMSGPSYETPAEVRMLRNLGADVVGMSTVPEAVTARATGMDVLAFAMVTNAAAGLGDDTERVINHQDVLEIAQIAAGRLGDLISEILCRSFLLN